MFPKHQWNSTVSSFHLQQLIKYPTRITASTCTLLDHIYADINCSFTEICDVQNRLSHHLPIHVTLNCGKEKSSPSIHHKIRFRSFNHFNLKACIADNDFDLFENILGISDLLTFCATFVGTDFFVISYNKHSP